MYMLNRCTKSKQDNENILRLHVRKFIEPYTVVVTHTTHLVLAFEGYFLALWKESK